MRGGFLVSLLGSFALLMFPLRTCLIELLWGGKDLKGLSGPAKAAAVSKIEQQYYAPLTYGILASTVATAVLVPDIWAALSIVGDLASTMQVCMRVCWHCCPIDGSKSVEVCQTLTGIAPLSPPPPSSSLAP